MTRLDISSWSPIRLGDVFEFEGIKQARTQLAIPDDENGIPYVIQSIRNNMVVRRVSRQWLIDHDEPPVPGNAIALGVTLPAVSYQRDEFGASQVITARNPRMNEYSGIFIAAVLSRYVTRFTYDDKPGISKYENLVIHLPALEDGTPDWHLMGAFMRKIFDSTTAKLYALKGISTSHTAVDVTAWKAFKLDELFDIKKGTRLTRANMKIGDIPFIGAANINNGITSYIANNEHLHPSGTLTVAYNGNGGTGKTFYQNESFWASDDVHILYPRFVMTRNIALFIATAIERVGRDKYGFADKWKLEYMRNDEIKLPVSADGTVDWAYMDNYMGHIIQGALTDIKALNDIL